MHMAKFLLNHVINYFRLKFTIKSNLKDIFVGVKLLIQQAGFLSSRGRPTCACSLATHLLF